MAPWRPAMHQQLSLCAVQALHQHPRGLAGPAPECFYYVMLRAPPVARKLPSCILFDDGADANNMEPEEQLVCYNFMAVPDSRDAEYSFLLILSLRGFSRFIQELFLNNIRRLSDFHQVSLRSDFMKHLVSIGMDDPRYEGAFQRLAAIVQMLFTKYA